MTSKPGGLGPEYAAQFGDRSVVDAYGRRPPYPDRLVSLILDVAGTLSLGLSPSWPRPRTGVP